MVCVCVNVCLWCVHADESGSGSEKGEEPEEGQQDPAPSASTFPNTQDLFGGDSS